ncbi:MAG: hypothetical protein HY606_13330 [Planctomycetes bacterium]|nr:hypothetical protein [Planctomycetota bacterium]
MKDKIVITALIVLCAVIIGIASIYGCSQMAKHSEISKLKETDEVEIKEINLLSDSSQPIPPTKTSISDKKIIQEIINIIEKTPSNDNPFTSYRCSCLYLKFINFKKDGENIMELKISDHCIMFPSDRELHTKKLYAYLKPYFTIK